MNSTGDSVAFRVGNRSEIRSHVRKGVSKRFRQKPSAGQRKLAAQPILKDSVPYNAELDNSEESSPIEDFPSSHLESTRLERTGRENLPLSTAPPLRELPILPKKYDSIIFNAWAEDSITELTDISSPQATVLCHCSHGSSASCKTCSGTLKSRKLGQRAQRRSGSVLIRRRGFDGQLKLSPLELLGAGRVDPFWSYPVENADNSLHELMDFGKLVYLHPFFDG